MKLTRPVNSRFDPSLQRYRPSKIRLDFSHPMYQDPKFYEILTAHRPSVAPQALIASPVASPAPITAPLATPLAHLAPVALQSTSTAPKVSPTLAPEASQPHTRPAEPKKPAGRSGDRTRAAPVPKTRAQIKAQEARAAKIHGLDATLIIGSRLRSAKKTKK